MADDEPPPADNAAAAAHLGEIRHLLNRRCNLDASCPGFSCDSNDPSKICIECGYAASFHNIRDDITEDDAEYDNMQGTIGKLLSNDFFNPKYNRKLRRQVLNQKHTRMVFRNKNKGAQETFYQLFGQLHRQGKHDNESLRDFLLAGNNTHELYNYYGLTLPDVEVLGPQPTTLRIQSERASAGKWDMEFMYRRFKQGKGFMCWTYLHDPENVTRERLPRPSTVRMNHLNSSSLEYYFMANAIHGRPHDAMAHITAVGGGLNHAHAPGRIFDIKNTSVSARPIPISREVMGQLRDFDVGNPCTYYANSGTTGIFDIFNSLPRDRVPELQFRNRDVYQNCHYTIQSVPPPGDILHRMGPNRYAIQVAEPCRRYNMPGAGAPFIQNLVNASAIMPPNWLSNPFIPTRPHLLDIFISPTYGSWDDGRRIELDQIMFGFNADVAIAARSVFYTSGINAWYNDVFQNVFNHDGLAEEGEFHYGHVCPFQCILNAAYKGGRAKYYRPHRPDCEGLAMGTVLHLEHNRAQQKCC